MVIIGINVFGINANEFSFSCEEHFYNGDGRCSIAKDGSILRAMGGTEMMRDGLLSRLPQIYLDNFAFYSSRVRELENDKKRHVLWLHDLPADVESERVRKDSFREKFDLIVFVSDWQKKQYEEYFKIDFGNKGVVLRNAIIPFSNEDVKKKSNKEPIRLIYHTTPHRGLHILLPVFERLYDKRYGKKIHLDVYSSFKMYGWEQRDEEYEELFDKCRNHPGCTYHGYKPNNEVREALKQSHIFAYPSIWEETSCIAAIEAMSAGVTIVAPDRGALPETVGDYGFIYPFDKDITQHATTFIKGLIRVIDSYWEPDHILHRQAVALKTATNYGWEGRVEEWIRVLAMKLP